MVLVDWRAQQDEPKVHEIRTLGLERDGEARAMLTDVARQVQPIMRKRSWVVPLLTEFKPPNPNLLGLNVGGGGGRTKEVKVRLRPHHSPSDFYPREHVLGTMLHELCHNVRSPHDSVFYKLLDEITEECEELMAKGISGTGQGFDGASAGRLGAHSFIPTHNPPSSQLRSLAAQAAEARAKKQRLMPLGPCRLGGGGGGASWRSLTPAEAAARAAMRRAADDLWCPCSQLMGQLQLGSAADAAAVAGPSAAVAGSSAAVAGPSTAVAGPSTAVAGGEGAGARGQAGARGTRERVVQGGQGGRLAAGTAGPSSSGMGGSSRASGSSSRLQAIAGGVRGGAVGAAAGSGAATAAAVRAAAAGGGTSGTVGAVQAVQAGGVRGAMAGHLVPGRGGAVGGQAKGPSRVVIDLTLSDEEEEEEEERRGAAVQVPGSTGQQLGGFGGGSTLQGAAVQTGPVVQGFNGDPGAVQAVQAVQAEGAGGVTGGTDMKGGRFAEPAPGYGSGYGPWGVAGGTSNAGGTGNTGGTGSQGHWACGVCTFWNVEGVGECEMCATPRP